MEVRPEHPMKAPPSIVVTLLGMVMEVRPEQSQKASEPIVVTLLGMLMEVRPEQPWKALFPIDFTLLGMVVFLQPVINVLDDVSIMALQLSRESYTALPLSTLIEVRPEQ